MESMEQHFINSNESKGLNSLAEVSNALSPAAVSRRHCAEPGFVFPQRRERRGEGHCVGPTWAPVQFTLPAELICLVPQHWSAGA